MAERAFRSTAPGMLSETLDYVALAAEYKACLARAESLPENRVRVPVPGDPAAPAREVIALYVVGWGARLVALDPALDPRGAARAAGRATSLSNYLNHISGLAGPGRRVGAVGGPGAQRWLPLCAFGPRLPGLDGSVEFERQAVVWAHDFRPENPERDERQVRAATSEYVLLWLSTGWALSGRVFNFDPEVGRGRAGRFLSVQAPKAYGTAGAEPWGRGLPFLAVNLGFVAGYRRALRRAELETFLAHAPQMQPEGYAPGPIPSG